MSGVREWGGGPEIMRSNFNDLDEEHHQLITCGYSPWASNAKSIGLGKSCSWGG